MATTSDVFGDLPEPVKRCPGCGCNLITHGCFCAQGGKFNSPEMTEAEWKAAEQEVKDFHHGMPYPGERIRILARTYEDARVAHRNMVQRGPGVSGMFIYIGVAQQMRGLRECRVFAVTGWSRLMDAPMIEQLAKGHRVEIVNYEEQ